MAQNTQGTARMKGIKTQTRRPPRLLVLAGVASGDLLAGSVVRALGDEWEVYGVGGREVRAARGARLRYRSESLGVMGIVEAIPAIPRALSIARGVLREAEETRPDVALLVDMPDFNFLVGPKLAAMGIPIVYLGAPQAWAWRPWRARQMARWIDVLACLYPFEPAWFGARGLNAEFVGHPRALEAARWRREGEGRDIVLLPGSRRSELKRHLPLLRELIPVLAQRYPDRRLLLPVAPSLTRETVLRGLGAEARWVEVVEQDALEVLSSAAVALVASGTAVTECVLMGVPCVVFYRVHPVSYAVARALIRVEHVAMANLLAGERLVAELLQHQAAPWRLLDAVDDIMRSPTRREALRGRLGALAASLSAERGTGERVAQILAGYRRSGQ